MMNIVMAANDYVYTGVELTIYSTLTHNKNINWYILTMDIDLNTGYHYIGLHDWMKDKLTKIVKYLDSNSNIVFIDCYDYYMQYLAGGPNDETTFTPYTALRLIIDKAIPFIDDALYLDCDVGVCGNFESMYNQCKQNKDEIAFAVYANDACFHEGEMVAGVMFYNLDVIKKRHFFERARYNFRNNYYIYPDQMAMRDAGEVARLDPLYGYMWNYKKENIKPVIIHFTNALTPKIYEANKINNKQWFYKIFPEFEYVDKGIKLLDTIVGL